MHLRATGIVLSVYRTVLLLCVFHLLVNSCVRSYPTETGGSRDSVRIEKLRWIVKRLTHLRQDPLVDKDTLTAETLAFIRSLTASIGTAHNTADTATETGDPSDITMLDKRQTRLEVLKRVYRQTNTPVGEFQEACVSLNNVMKPFLQTLKVGFSPAANKVLNNVVRLLEVLPPNDPAFALRDVDTLLRKFYILDRCLQAVLDHSLEYVQNDYKAWFTSQYKQVEYKLNVAVGATIPLSLETSSVQKMPGAISIVNPGVQARMPRELINALYELLSFLETKTVQSLPS
ncbi:hypothetical protein BsWGS_04180 [Bradybaena similaris]